MNPSYFTPELNSILAYAKTIKFSFETGTIEDLMRGWINRGLKMNQDIDDNKEDVIRMIKSLVNR